MFARHASWRGAAADSFLGAVLAAVAVLGAAGDFPDASAPAGALMALAGVAQAWRRIRPLTAFAVSFALMGAVALFFGHYESGGSLLIGLVASYSAVAYGSNLPFVVATLLAFTAVLNLPGQSLDQALADLAFTLPVLLLAGGAGEAVRGVRARAEASAAREVALEAERTRAAEDAAGAERQRIHREMHDILSHSLAVIVLQSGAAEQALERDPQRACEAIRAARTTAQEALSQLHIMLRMIRAEPDGWRDPAPDLDRLRHLAKQATAAGFPVELTMEGRPTPVPATVQTSLYRVAQEGLANSMKHSGAAGCQIVLRYLPDTVEVEVLDRGTGRQQGTGARVGLAGIQERASVFGGHVHSGPRPDGGWSLRVAIPIPA